MRLKTLLLLPLLLGAAASAAARSGARDVPQNPEVLQKVLGCRSIADDKARLACFDSSVGTLGAASERGDVTVLDREQVRQTRRSLFGFELPSLALFGHKEVKGGRVEATEEISEITAKVTAVSQNQDGGVILTLEDGARWEQTDAVILGRKPKPGSTVTIKRAALGSYKMRLEGGVFVKARRLG